MAVPSLPPSWLEDDLPIQLDISLSRSLAPSLCSPSPSPPIPLYQHVHDPFEPTYRNLHTYSLLCAHARAGARSRGNTRPLDVSSILSRRRPVKFNHRPVNALLAGYESQFAGFLARSIVAKHLAREISGPRSISGGGGGWN